MAGLRSGWGAAGALAAATSVLIACAKADGDVSLPGLNGDDGGDPNDPNNSERIPGSGDDDTNASSSSGSSGSTKKDGGTGDGGGSSSGNVTTACGTALAKAAWDFESGSQGWTHTASDGAQAQASSWPFDPWGQGQDGNGLDCPDGSCFGAEIDENYAQCSRGELLSPSVDLSACSGQNVQLTFSHAFDFWTDTYSGTKYFDGGIVELSGDGGSTWSVPAGTYPGTLKILKAQTSSYKCVDAPYHADGKQGFVGSQLVAQAFTVTVPAAMLTNKVRIRFSTAAGVSTQEVDPARDGTAAGWRIDDVKFVGGP